jgi:hypothetical protein
MSTTSVTFTAISTLNVIPNGDHFIDAGSGTDLKVHPETVVDMYMDAAGEATKDGCIAFVHSTTCGLSTMMHYMVAKGWITPEKFLQEMIEDFNAWAEMPGDLTFKKPPEGGLLG